MNIHSLARFGDVEGVAQELRGGVPVDTIDEFGTTPLMIAAEHARIECMRLLLNAGADINRADLVGEKAILKAKSIEVIKMLVAAGNDLNEISDEARAVITSLKSWGKASDLQGEIRRRQVQKIR